MGEGVIREICQGAGCQGHPRYVSTIVRSPESEIHSRRVKRERERERWVGGWGSLIVGKLAKKKVELKYKALS